MITPINTKYKGYNFRSRLEARWAVFFDAAGIKYFYEQQGFNINGKCYLPDFYLPDFGYFEVKGRYLFDKDLMCDFANEINETLFIVFEEIPDPTSNEGYIRSFLPESKLGDDFNVIHGFNEMFLRCDGCGKITIQNEVYCTIKHNCCEGYRYESLSNALEEARTARFK